MLFMRVAGSCDCRAKHHRVSNPIISILHHVHNDPGSGFQVSRLGWLIASGDRSFPVELHVHVALRCLDGQDITLDFDHSSHYMLHASMSKDPDREHQ